MFIIYTMLFPNGKKYIGITKNLTTRKNKHKCRAEKKEFQHLKLYRAIHKFGFDNIEWIVSAQYDDFKTALAKEIEYIAMLNTTNIKFGYNTTDGGEGCLGFKPSAETKLKISLANKGKRKPINFGSNLSKARTGIGNPMYGKRSSIKQKNAVSLAVRGEKNGNSKLTDKQVQELIDLWNTKSITKIQLAKTFKINRNTVTRILSGKSRIKYIYNP